MGSNPLEVPRYHVNMGKGHDAACAGLTTCGAARAERGSAVPVPSHS